MLSTHKHQNKAKCDIFNVSYDPDEQTIDCHCVVCGSRVKLDERYFIIYGAVCENCNPVYNFYGN